MLRMDTLEESDPGIPASKASIRTSAQFRGEAFAHIDSATK
jgi:hypothetical protein